MRKWYTFTIGLGFLIASIIGYLVNGTLKISIGLFVLGIFLIWYVYKYGKELDEADYQKYINEKKQKEENYKRRKERVSQIWEAFKNPSKKK